MRNILPFFGRIREHSIFESCIFRKPGNESSVLIFHGPGGIGKSMLFNSCKKKIQRDEPSFAFVDLGYLDFSEAVPQSPARLLVSLRRSFATKIDFSLFDYATMINWAVNYRDEAPPPTEYSFIQTLGNTGSADTAESLFDAAFDQLKSDGSLLGASGSNMLSLFDGVPFARFVIERCRDVIFSPDRLLKFRGLDKELDHFYEIDPSGKRIATKQPSEIANAMLPCFISDLKRHFKKNEDRQLVILIDQLESLYDRERLYGHFGGNKYDLQLQALVKELEQLTLCFFCREPITLTADIFWRDFNGLKAHKLGEFEDNEVSKLLKTDYQCTPQETRILLNSARRRESLVADGNDNILPIYLNEAVSIFLKDPSVIRKALNKGDNEISLKDAIEVITKRQINHLSDKIQSFLKIVSLCNNLDQEIWKDENFRSNLDLSRETVNATANLSIVEKTDQPILNLDPFIASGIRHLLPENETNEIIELLIKAFEDLIERRDIDENFNLYMQAFESAVKLKQEHFPSGLVPWLEKITNRLLNNECHTELQNIWQDTLNFISNRSSGAKRDLLVCYSDLAFNQSRAGKTKDALRNVLAAVELLGDDLDYNRDAAIIMSNFGEILSSSQAEYVWSEINPERSNATALSKALEILKTANEIELDYGIEDDYIRLAILNNYAYALALNGESEKAKECLQKIFEIGEYTDGQIHNNLWQVYATLAYVACIDDELEKVEKYQVLSIRSLYRNEEFGPLGNIKANLNSAEIFRWFKKETKAIRHYEKVIEVYEDNPECVSIDVVNAYLGLAFYSKDKDVKRCKYYIEKARAIFDKHEFFDYDVSMEIDSLNLDVQNISSTPCK